MSEYIIKGADWAICHNGDSLFKDAEEIVRCKNCKFGVYGGKYCAEGCADSWEWRNVEPNGFCAWGERRGA